MRRQLFEIPLRPVLGSRFQPTGFPNLGAAEFERPAPNGGWEPCLLVESAQSMANHLERTLWPDGSDIPDPIVTGLPYVEVRDAQGAFATSSRIEAHRLASPYVRDGMTADGLKGSAVINERLGLDRDRPRAPREIASGVMATDPMCLVHGAFFSVKDFPGQPKIPRVITACVEAHDVKPAHSGGVKKDSVQTSVAAGGTGEGRGMVPFDRTEYVAQHLVCYAAIDLDQITSYGLTEDAADLLAALARLELRRLLDGSMRLRTACDLAPIDDDVVDQDGQSLPDMTSLEAVVSDGIAACVDAFPHGPVLTVTYDTAKHRKAG